MQWRRTLTLSLFRRGEGNLRRRHVRVTEQESKTGAHLLSPLGAGRIKVMSDSDWILAA
jgi:hypothetical protein